MQIKCDKCGFVAETIMPETARNGDIEHTFFRCPACGEVYPIAVTDDSLRKSIAEYDRRRQLIRIHPVTEQFLRDTEALKQDNLKRCKELMEQHPLALFLENHADILERLERETE